MLNGVLPLGDIRDVEKLCDWIVEQALQSRQVSIPEADREDAVAYLISEAWLLWSRYDPQRGAKFSTVAHLQLRMRFVDWWRRKTGMRSSRAPGRRQQPGEWGCASLDEMLAAMTEDDAAETRRDSGLRRALASSGADDTFDRVASVDGIVRAAGGRRGGLVDAGSA